jgi:hypothetical protein
VATVFLLLISGFSHSFLILSIITKKIIIIDLYIFNKKVNKIEIKQVK